MYVSVVVQKSGGKLAGGYVELGGEEEPAKKKRKVVAHAVRPTLASQFRAADTADVKQVGGVWGRVVTHNSVKLFRNFRYGKNTVFECEL